MYMVSGTIFMTLNFFLTYKWAQKARKLQYTTLKGSTVKKQYSLLGAFVSYNKMRWYGYGLWDCFHDTLFLLNQ
jgi:hypothetical protein